MCVFGIACLKLYGCLGVWESIISVMGVLVSKIVRYFINLIFSKIFEVQPK